MRSAAAAALALLLTCAWARCGAQASVESLYPVPAHEEDWRFLADRTQRRDDWDVLKFVRLSADGNRYVSFGGEVRVTYERFTNPDFGKSPKDSSGYFLQRYLLHGDLHLSSGLRVFAGLSSSLENGRNGGPRPVIDENRLDLHEAFVELARSGSAGPLVLRIGRQELALGSGRILSLREEPNVPLSFDGLRLRAQLAPWKIDVLALAPVQSQPGVFDDWHDPHFRLWGVYATRTFTGSVLSAVDLYYLGVDRDHATYNQGSASERRHTLGLRVTRSKGAVRFDHETMIQVGRFGSGDITAWRLSLDTSYVFERLAWKPEIRLAADAASGDRDPSAPGLQTYNGLFPSGSYSCRCLLEGPANNLRLQPVLSLQPSAALRIRSGWAFFWRQSRGDGLYGVAGNLLVPANGAGARYEGTRPIAQVDWQMTRHASLHVNADYYFTGPFGKQAESAPSSLSYFSVWAAYRF
jgi:hypothetical protein